MKIPFLHRPPSVAVIRLQGVIGASSRGSGGGLSDAGLAPLLERAFKRRKPKAMTYYSEDEAPKLLGVTRAEFAKLMRSSPLPPEALVVSPAAHAWSKDTLAQWHAAATGRDGAK